MKKLQIKTIIGAVLLALILAGCGNQEATTDLENPVKEESVEETTSEKVNEEKQTEEEESAPETVEEEQTQEEESVPEVVEEVAKIEKSIPKHLEIKYGDGVFSYNYIEQDGKAILTDMSNGLDEVHYNYMTDDNGKIKFGLGLDYMFGYFNRRMHNYYVNRETNSNLRNVFGEWNFADCPLLTTQEEYVNWDDGSRELTSQLSFEYDSNEKLTRIIENADRDTSESYEVVDLGDNVYSATYKYSSEPYFSDSGEETAIFTLDGNGNALQIEEKCYYKDDEGEREFSSVTNVAYDAQNNMVREECDFGDGIFEIHEYSYDESGNVTEIKQYHCEDNEQNLTDSAIISYDENGNVLEEVAFLKDAEYDIRYEYEGTMVTAINVNGEIAYEFTYDENNRLSAIYNRRENNNGLGLSKEFSDLIGKYTGIYNAIVLGMRDCMEVHFYYE
ncbi:hypothetical protein KQI22_13390 [Kineothrix sp. MSJ-39]|uniref:hypothetical protein n=1 Tax=Kineothrix sp. MSJ-39 TaxID=2841533 RepID=UPI001C1253F0|nr:hypothetical protein [Kineothrix sp. MSJ-39]MBU5431042.1 hypothetical protein [Kineothrix sp. MSJ-39]